MYRLFLPIAFVVAVVACTIGLDKTKPRADFVFVNRGDVFTLDPQRMSWLTDMQVAYCLYEGLVRWNTKDFSIELAAADKLDISEDGLVYTFHIFVRMFIQHTNICMHFSQAIFSLPWGPHGVPFLLMWASA